MPAKTDAQKVARLLMKHSGCHQYKIHDLSSKHMEFMKSKPPYRCSSKGLRSSDGSKKSVALETPLRKAIKPNRLDNPLRRTIRLSDIPESKDVEVDNTGNPVLKSRRESFVERPRHEKPRPSDAFMNDHLIPVVSLSDLAKSGRFEVKDDHLYKHSSVKRPCVACRIDIRDPNAKVINLSSELDIVYQDGCDCHFCSLLRYYHGSVLMFSTTDFITEKGHGFFPKL